MRFPNADPVTEAREHLETLCSIVTRSAGSAGDVDLDRLAGARPTWPTWPTPALASLIGPPPVIVSAIDLRWLHRFEATVAWLGALGAQAGGPTGGPSGLSLLVERAAMLGHRAWGTTSAGTSCRLLRCADAWIALNLPRLADIEALPAWLDGAVESGTADDWTAVADAVSSRSSAALLEQARLLGMAVAVAPIGVTADLPAPAVTITATGEAPLSGRRPMVLDCSSLWAGPLCGWYLARSGADVVKVESSRRPDGSRTGAEPFWRRLNSGKSLVELDLATVDGVRSLRAMVAQADIVIEASRPRAMAGFGIDPSAEVERGAIWCSITGYGRGGPWSDRVAFGDDAAVAGGLVADTGAAPWFIGDAAADPITGATAAAFVMAMRNAGRAGLVDVSMAGSVASLTGGTAVPVRL